MKKFLSPKTLLLVSFFIFPAFLFAKADSKTPFFPNVKSVLENPVEDEDVSLEGFITKKIDDELYVFKDESGEIEIEVDKDDFPSENITPDTRVRLEGEIDTHFMRKPSIEVDQIKLFDAPQRGKAPKVLTVKRILNNPVRFGKTALEGTIVLFTDDDEFVLKDDTGYIYVDAEDDAKDALKSIKEGSSVHVEGDIKIKKFDDLKISRPVLKADIVKKVQN